MTVFKHLKKLALNICFCILIGFSIDCGVEQPGSCQAYNLKVVGSNQPRYQLDVCVVDDGPFFVSDKI